MVVKLAEACKVPLHTVHNWRGGLCRIPELAKDKIEEVTGVKIFHSENILQKKSE
ncbi:helix-turn-helix domain-containing protein [Bacteroides thetaiotaomicron]|nr:helix-turn-helix domain-containing protein [Bacteroides thetaiotaomicron]